MKPPESGSQMDLKYAFSTMSIVRGPLQLLGTLSLKGEPVSREGVHRRKERTNFKEGFQLELTAGGKSERLWRPEG